VLLPWIPARLHGWLDELATLTYVAAALLLHYGGAAFVLLLAAAAVHFLNTRLTDYPEGQLKLYGLKVHARIELVEGMGTALAFVLLPELTTTQRAVGAALGVLQIGAATLADLRWPAPVTASAKAPA
jgi:hypothetical protein